MGELPSKADLKRLHISPEQFATRPVVAVGYNAGELFEPYDCVDPKRAEAILDYVHAATRRILVPTANAIPHMDTLRYRGESNVIEVVGGRANYCVRDAVAQITREGFIAYVDPQKIFSANPEDSDERLAAMVTREGQYMNYSRVNMEPNFYYNPEVRKLRR